ncbi:MAG: DMT family transporter [Candidatus Levybacteria bacterium]|nr:DMT family transporter [Candidatus Levybacteria bacterium]
MSLSNKQKAILALIIANIIWGAASPIFKWSLQNVQPFTLAFLRFYLGALLLLPFLRHIPLGIKKQHFFEVFLIAFFGITVNISFFFLALQKTASINAPIIASSGPILLILGSMIFLKEHPGIKKIAGGLMGLMGVIIIILQPLIEKGLDASVTGNLFLIIATLSSIIPVFILRKLTKIYEPMTLVFWSFVISAITFLPFFVHEIQTYYALSNITIQGWTGIIYGAAFSSAAAYFLQYWAIKYLFASEIGLFTYLDPVVAIVIAGPLLGEVPTATFLLGTLLVFGGIYIAEGRIQYHPFHKLSG